MTLEQLKNVFLKAMLACLVAAGVVGVVTILVGEFNDLAAKALLTILLVALHCLVSFGFILNNEKQETFESLTFFTNVTFGLIILSFITSVFGVWNILPDEVVGKLYAFYFVLLFATLHAEILAKTRGKRAAIDNVVFSNYVFMGIVVFMLVPVIFFDNSYEILGSFYYRLLAAAGVVDATLTLVAIILHKLYIRSHPMVNDGVFNLPQTGSGQPGPQATPAATAQRHHGSNIFVNLLIAYLVLQFVGGFLLMGVSFLLNR